MEPVAFRPAPVSTWITGICYTREELTALQHDRVAPGRRHHETGGDWAVALVGRHITFAACSSNGVGVRGGPRVSAPGVPRALCGIADPFDAFGKGLVMLPQRCIGT